MAQATKVLNPPTLGQFPLEFAPQQLPSGIRSLEVDNGSSLTLTIEGDGAVIRVIPPYVARVCLNTSGSWQRVRIDAGGTVAGSDVITMVAYDSAVMPPFLPSLDPIVGSTFVRPISLGPNGGIYQGTGTFDSPTTGLKIFENGSGFGEIDFYDTGAAILTINQNGIDITAGSIVLGGVTLDSSGLSGPSFTLNSSGLTVTGGSITIGTVTLDSNGLTIPAFGVIPNNSSLHLGPLYGNVTEQFADIFFYNGASPNHLEMVARNIQLGSSNGKWGLRLYAGGSTAMDLYGAASGSFTSTILSIDSSGAFTTTILTKDNLAGVAPAAFSGGVVGGAIGANQTNGLAEVDFFNLFNGPTQAFAWYTYVGGVLTKLAHLDASGNLVLKGALTQNGSP